MKSDYVLSSEVPVSPRWDWFEDLALAMHCAWDEEDRVEWAARGPLTLLDFFPELSAPRGGIRYVKPPVECTVDLRGVSDEMLDVLMGGYPQPVERSVDNDCSVCDEPVYSDDTEVCVDHENQGQDVHFKCCPVCPLL